MKVPPPIRRHPFRFTVESPGTLPGLVRTNNIREIHFSRNPKIIEFLHEYEYVKEFGEGVQEKEGEVPPQSPPQLPPKSDITDGRI